MRMALRATGLIVIWAVLYPGTALAGETAAPRLTVCELFQNLRAFRGKRVSVSGIAVGAHGYYALIGEGCPTHFVTKGYTWPTTVTLLETTNIPRDEMPPRFRTAEVNVQELRQAVSDARDGRQVWISVVGEVRLKKRYELVRTNYGVMGRGYGFLGNSPALMVIEQIEEVTVK